MIRYLLISMAIFGLSFCGNSQDKPVLSLEIEFDGAKEEYYKKYNLWTEVSDSLLISQIVNAIDTSESLPICPSIRPVMWEIDVFADYGSGEDENLFKIGSNTVGKLSLQKRGRCYDNSPLVEMLMGIVKVEEIGEFLGPMNQADYDRLLNQD